jgi:hypothetical protein
MGSFPRIIVSGCNTQVHTHSKPFIVATDVLVGQTWDPHPLLVLERQQSSPKCKPQE